MDSERAIDSLREALRFSPENVPLRRHLAESLLNFGRPDEAESEFRTVLNGSPEDMEAKLGLARCFERQGKTTQALVVLEDLASRPTPPPRGLVLLARLLDRTGHVEEAVKQYRRGIAADPSVADAEFAGRLGIRAGTESDEADDEDDTGEFEPTSDEDERYEVVDGRVRSAWESDSAEGPSIDLERPTLRFADVGGMDAVKDEVRMKIIHPLTHVELYKAYGKAIGGGILMYGPPGCGKTYLARATAGEIHAGFIAVGIDDVLEMWLGNSERNLHAIFERARRSTPCVLFFDEVDALAASRSDMRGGAGRQLINQFLAELDGVRGPNDGVLVLAATNAPWHLDSAFRRPGRFDRILFVPPPDVAARAAILRVLTRGKPVADIDYDHLAKKTDGFSGADLKALIDVAVERKLREAMKSGMPRPLGTKDLVAAAGEVRPSTREWFATARNHALYANQGGIYDDILKYLKI